MFSGEKIWIWEQNLDLGEKSGSGEKIWIWRKKTGILMENIKSGQKNTKSGYTQNRRKRRVKRV